jgi:hypothetical protein
VNSTRRESICSDTCGEQQWQQLQTDLGASSYNTAHAEHALTHYNTAATGEAAAAAPSQQQEACCVQAGEDVIVLSMRTEQWQ